MRVLHLFAGSGGSHLAGEMLGWQSVGSVEVEPYCQAVLRHHYPKEVIHGDIRTFSAKHLLGAVDGVCGGFPCQDISPAGKGAGITGSRSGLWKEFLRVIEEACPSWAFIENSHMLRTRGLGVVLADLAALGYDAEWSTYKASDVGAPHRRDRMWILAHSKKVLSHGSYAERREVSELRNGCMAQDVAESDKAYDQGVSKQPCGVYQEQPNAHSTGGWWANDPADAPESQMGRVVNGLANPLLRWNRVHALASLGNGWVPQQAAEAFRQLWSRACSDD